MQFPQSRVEFEQFGAQAVPFDLTARTGSTTTDDADTISDNLSALMREVGPAILITHSQSGPFRWHTRIKNSNVKAIISYEPMNFVFPDQDLPAGEIGIPREAFAKRRFRFSLCSATISRLRETTGKCGGVLN